MRRLLLFIGTSLVLAGPAGAVPPGPERLGPEEPAAPWRPRRRPPGPNRPAGGMALIDLAQWPPEPVSPKPVEQERFARGLRQLCGERLRRGKGRLYGRWMLELSRKFEIDPFLLAAVAYRSSRCDPRIRRGHRGGLATVHWRTHRRFFERGAYRYWVLEDGAWQQRSLALGDYRFRPAVLRRSRPSLYFAAALLSVYGRQCPAIDTRFGSVPHRHAVSHLIWGDRVEDAGSEDRVLRARRRLIAYYLEAEPRKVGTLDGLALYCPLDGAPRKISSGLGDVRGNGHHAHRGVDFASTIGEPVRAVADGVVFRAGVDLPRRGSRPVAPDRSRYVRRSRMGRGGLFVMIRHTKAIYSAYMHLQRFTVRDGQPVRGGELIGHVGRSGIKRDPAHLHFEVRKNRRPVDPVPLLGRAVLPPEATFRGRLIREAQPRRWRRIRYRRWVRRKRRLARRKRARARRARARKRARARVGKRRGPAQ